MKILKFIPALLPLLMAGCLEIDTNTQINPDGSVERTIELKGSASSIAKTSFNIPRVDAELWEITRDSIGDDNFLYHAQRSFDSVDDMNTSFEANTNPQRVKIKSKLIQSEGLFFSRYYYQEKLWADLPGPDLSLDEYLSELELQNLILNDTDIGAGTLDSLEAERLEQQLDLYFQHRIFGDFVEELRIGAKLSGTLQILNEVLENQQDSLVVKLGKTNYYDENQVWISVLEDYFDNKIIESIHENNAEGLSHFYARWQFFEEALLNDYSFSIELPGVVRNTSALDVRGNRMTWDGEAILLYFGGIQLEAESSIIRVWSVVITAILFLLTLVVTVLSFLRQRSAHKQI